MGIEGERGRPVAAALVVPIALFVLSGCISALLPTLRTERIDVTGVGAEGLTLHVRMTATNENYSQTIGIDALRLHVTVGDQDLGMLDVPETWQLPPNQPVVMETDVVVPLQNLPALALQAASGPVPYHLDGNAHVQNVGWSVDFEYDGYIPPEQLLGGAIPGIPSFLLP